jgi:ATP phosphoribosyltransferase regulatory subunit
MSRGLPATTREGLLALAQLYGDEKVLDEARVALKSTPGIDRALSNLKWLASQLGDARVTFDLADLRGYAYYSGPRFSVYASGAGDALVRGGRYDGVGAVFGHNHDRARPAVGFSLDLKNVVGAAAPRPLKAAIRAPWGEDATLRAAIAALRGRGETVVGMLPGHDTEIDEFHCDRELIEVAGQWVVQAI